MPKALFFNLPAHGHINPSLPLVAELTRRGHEIVYFAAPAYRASIEAAGAAFRACEGLADDYFEAAGLGRAAPLSAAYALISASAAILPRLLEIARAEKPDYIIYDGLCTWGRLVARILRLPAVASLALRPLSRPPPLALLRRLPLILPPLWRDCGAGAQAVRRARALAGQYGLPPIGLMSIINNTGDLSISYTSSAFQPFPETVDRSVRFVGWTLNESAADAGFSLAAARGRRVIYVSLGTVNNADAGFFRACIEAFTGLDVCVVISTGKRIAPQSFGTLPENIAVHAWVPQVAALKQAALFITHGGMNSLNDGLYLGVPLLLVPQQLEQTLNAMRAVELGAGLLLKKRQVSPATLRQKALRLLNEPAFGRAAQRLGETLRTAGGAARAADAVEALLNQHCLIDSALREN